MKLFSISQGKPHPSAPIHTFNIPAEAIHSEYVGVATAVVHDCILGGLVSEGMLYEDNNSSPCFEPLEGDMMLFFRMGWNAIEIGAIRQLGNLEPDVPDVQSFLLPTVNAHIDFMTSAMEAWTWTLPDWEEFAADPAHAPGRLPFHALPENRLITFDTTYGELHRLTFVIPCKNLSALVKRYLPLEPDDAYDHIPWQEWGPQRVHIVRTDSITYGKAVGQRWFFADEQGIGFRDFNPSRVSHAATHFGRAPRVQKNGCTIKVVWGPVVVMPQGGALKEDVVSSLPYVETRLPIPPEDHRSTVGIAVDDERLVHVFDKKIEGGRVQRWMNIYLLA
ncbi:hypothetical protein BC834DRAFT_183235 [Gloeopeniophorella convolvens]|nr:hypothetical protein BC834DRAFT_183235 [Gloeopeniophorella convolvens]